MWSATYVRGLACWLLDGGWCEVQSAWKVSFAYFGTREYEESYVWERCILLLAPRTMRRATGDGGVIS